MQLTIGERIAVFALLAPIGTGNFVTLRTLQELRKELTVTEAEREEIGLEQPDPKVDWLTWNPELDPNKDIKINDTAKKLVVHQLALLDQNQQLTMREHYSLCEKFGFEPEGEPAEEGTEQETGEDPAE